MSSLRRLVHLVMSDAGICGTYSLRSIDVSGLFVEGCGGGRADHCPPEEPSPLPPPNISFYPPVDKLSGNESIEFMPLGGKHNKVVATDQTGRTVLYDPNQHAVRAMPNLKEPKTTCPVSLTIGDDLYILETINPEPPYEDGCFECLEYHDWDSDWHPRILPTPPYEYKYEDLDLDPGIDSYTVVDGGNIWISKALMGTYAFNTATEAWNKAGDWMLPFTGLAHYVPEHRRWFGLSNSRDHGCVLCAVDLAAASARRPPAMTNLWKDLTPPVEWTLTLMPHLVHLGAGRFCITRFFESDQLYPVTHTVFTGVEVKRCADTDGGLRMVMHSSKRYTLLSEMMYWVL